MVSATRLSMINAALDPANRRAWGAFYTKYCPLVFSYARKAGLQEADADNVVQDVMQALIGQLHEYDPARGHFRTWLYAIAIRKVRKAMRERYRRLGQQVVDESGTGQLERIVDPRPDELRTRAEAGWTVFVLAHCCQLVSEELSPRELQVLNRYILGEQPAAEVASSLGITPANLYTIKHRLVERFRKLLAEMEESE